MTNDKDDGQATPPRQPIQEPAPLEAPPPPLPPQRQRHFKILEKLASFVRNVRRKMGEGLSQHAACEDLNIHRGIWVKQLGDFGQEQNNKSRSLCRGRISSLAPFQNELLCLIFELRKQGMAVSISIVKIKAAQLSTEFA
ncbi:hypothetical protein MHU86_6859 [Fragilaria crotonensis]|nr:hypothetical protein MHU86_6859 [Fragilaria crotonensis]